MSAVKWPVLLGHAVRYATLGGALAFADQPAPLERLDARRGQLSAPVAWLVDPARSGVRYHAQKTAEGRLLLTPNEAFFSTRGLRATGAGLADLPAASTRFNGGKSFGRIEGWREGAQVEWPVWLASAGQAVLFVRMRSTQTGKRFALSLGDQRVTLVTRASAGHMWTARLPVTRPGRQTVSLRCLDPLEPGTLSLHWIELTGPAAVDGAVLRARWRPAAAHTKFTSSQQPTAVRMWVMELDGAPGKMGFYSPVTSPFGYFGSSWSAAGQVKPGINFSMWSFGRGQAAPPIEQLSHLLAIGNREARFGGFSHEGTGVKVRGWEVYADRQEARQLLALRVEPGARHDTYYGYFYDFAATRWRLYAAGNKRRRGRRRARRSTSLFVGAFVEVPGPPQRQRTGHLARRMRYRGWVVDAQRRWYALDQMRGEGKPGTYGNRTRGKTADDRFYLQMGGLAHVGPNPAVRLTPTPRSQVPYLSDEAVKPLFGLPSKVTVTASSVEGAQHVLTVTVRNPGTRPKLTVFWGGTEGLTFADRWEHRRVVAPPRNGVTTVRLPSSATHVRLLLQADHGQFWSLRTFRPTPPE